MSELSKSVKELQAKLESLEIKVAYQEDTIESLNKSVIQQQEMLDKQSRIIEKLVDKVKTIDNDHLPSAEEIEIPPHY